MELLRKVMGFARDYNDGCKGLRSPKISVLELGRSKVV